MMDIDIAVKTAEKVAARPEKKAAVKGGLGFEKVLIVTVALVAIIGSYESLTEVYYPAHSLLSALHRNGYLRQYAIVYEPSKGIWHPLGWLGSAMMVVMMLYSLRKRVAFLSSMGSMRHWLSAHMFLGIMGPLLVTLHTTFKYHGIVATSFWCMTVTMVFGILGRYIYVQIPRSIGGAELGVKDIERMVEGLDSELGRHLSKASASSLLSELGVKDTDKILRSLESDHAARLNSSQISRLLREINFADDGASERGPIGSLFFMMKTDLVNLFKVFWLKRILKRRYNLSHTVRDEIAALIKDKAALIRKKNFLSTSHSLLHYWHVLHIPLAIVMFIIMFLHILVYYVFRPVL